MQWKVDDALLHGLCIHISLLKSKFWGIMVAENNQNSFGADYQLEVGECATVADTVASYKTDSKFVVVGLRPSC